MTVSENTMRQTPRRQAPASTLTTAATPASTRSPIRVATPRWSAVTQAMR